MNEILKLFLIFTSSILLLIYTSFTAGYCLAGSIVFINDFEKIQSLPTPYDDTCNLEGLLLYNEFSLLLGFLRPPILILMYRFFKYQHKIFISFLACLTLLEFFMFNNGLEFINIECENFILSNEKLFTAISAYFQLCSAVLYIISGISIQIGITKYKNDIEMLRDNIYNRIVGAPERGRDDAYSEF